MHIRNQKVCVVLCVEEITRAPQRNVIDSSQEKTIERGGKKYNIAVLACLIVYLSYAPITTLA
jgi:hypothetical protein